MMNDPNGLAFALMFCAFGLLFLLLACIAELYAGREMRKRQRQRVALERYLGLVYPRDQP